MKRVETGKTSPSSYSNRVARIMPQQAEFFARRARDGNEAKIAAAGTRGWLYQRVTAGPACTCGITGYETLLDDGGNLTPEGTDSIVREALALDRGLEVFRAEDLELPVAPDPLLQTQVMPVADAEPIDLMGFDDQRCAVCFGSGRRPGFRLAGGFRDVLVPSQILRSDFKIDTGNRPNTAENGTWVEFDVILPQRMIVSRVWDRNEVPHLIVPTSKPERGARGVLRFQTALDWTHFELLSLGDGIPVDFATPPQQDVSDTQYAEADFEIPGRYAVPLQSVIIEDRTSRAWQVRTVTPRVSNAGETVSQTVNCRRVRPNELTALLMADPNRVDLRRGTTLNSSAPPLPVGTAPSVVEVPTSTWDQIGW